MHQYSAVDYLEDFVQADYKEDLGVKGDTGELYISRNPIDASPTHYA